MRGRLGAALTGLALVAVAITSYLTLVKVTGGAPACALVSGCETVNDMVARMLVARFYSDVFMRF